MVVAVGRGFKSLLSEILPPDRLEALKTSVEIVGDIAIIKIPPELEKVEGAIGEALLKALPSLRTVLKQTSPVAEAFRVRGLEYLAGERKTSTLYREHGCLFKVDLAQAYFSSRLKFERGRVASLVGVGEVVVNMFSGVGCFSIIAAKNRAPTRVFSIDINPYAVAQTGENVKLNRLEHIITPILGDAKEVVENQLVGGVDRVLMPLPEKAYEYLDVAVRALRGGRTGWIHYYDFVYSKEKREAALGVEEEVRGRLEGLGVGFSVENRRIVRPVGPRWFQVALDISVSPPLRMG